MSAARLPSSSSLPHSSTHLMNGHVRALIFLVLSCAAHPAQPSDFNSRQAELLNEVSESIKDAELAKQIVEIRMRREANVRLPLPEDSAGKKIIPIRNANNAISTNSTNNEITTSTSAKKVFAINEPISNAIYTGVGRRMSVGFSHKLSSDFALRADASGISKTDTTKSVDSGSYSYVQKDSSLGAYVDWFPTSSSFRITGGLNFNRMKTSLNGLANSSVNINGSRVNLGTNVFNVEFQFPTVTPFVGVGFDNKTEDSVGLHFYGDLGFVLGKYNAKTTTNLVGIQGVKASDLDAEMNTLRRDLYKWSFIPTAAIGLSYRFN